MAFHTLVTGEGDGSAVAQCAVYCAYYVHEATVGGTHLGVFRVAEAALHDCAVRGKAEGKFSTTTDGMAAIQKVLIFRMNNC